MKKGPPPLPEEERFLRKVRKTPRGCWLWTGSVGKKGYAYFGVGSRYDGTRRTVLAHRWAYEFYVGEIPPDHEVDHRCHIGGKCNKKNRCVHRRCVNPEHLQAVPHVVNVRRGKGAKTHCPRGHPYKGANLYVVPATGHRQCRECKRDAYRRWKERNK